MKIWKKHSNSGFTIIEVTIVLAIAGLIMGIVFLAVPALQRNTHNTQRRSDASHLASIVQEYAANHGGRVPNTAQLATFIGSDSFTIMSSTVTVDGSGNTTADGTTAAMVVHPGVVCLNDGSNGMTTTNANSQSFAISYKVELSGGGSDTSCFSN